MVHPLTASTLGGNWEFRSDFYLWLLSPNCIVESSLTNGNFPFSHVIFGFGRPLNSQSKRTLSPAFRSSLETVGRLAVLNCSGAGSAAETSVVWWRSIDSICTDPQPGWHRSHWHSERHPTDWTAQDIVDIDRCLFVAPADSSPLWPPFESED